MMAWYITFSSCVLGGALGLMALNRWVKPNDNDKLDEKKRD